ncbi:MULTISPECIES: TauD/TfdA family dioxygenase [unclassified Variovorax]|uniref:TauD/TfdA dioxygenase family protein n=1 Tax=unclassified Variovorax TaxID=663243 RepID=UPI00076CEE27|nr:MULTISPECIES: TauD/TfdA family dioxygenase [unclassified Variovorax]KWT98801.1 putative dioxygenase [Variovorax sp. WDL1]PNG56135.1 Alpha-ketoglutarate-dependent 2,4-dichlorophenoxyacetate dioxygenase [Variovorax sp. B4]PNG57559.1 Alpha-ketoglutarate-dependent 2,4-dichlorophenoxyacetate dioxygenase [Variovorax sp. B2]VTV10040.1 Alpha-ketoglutarate-dependent 2,4-dichlorophenoxyacetate dioxygenase [Variovorax sp. WDL1]
MPLRLKPLHPLFVAEASGIDITRPLSDAEVRQINAAMNEYAVLVWRSQPLTGQQQIDFAKSFGPLDLGLKKVFKRKERLEDERLIDISNVDAEGNVARRDSPKNLSNFANQLWHSDSSFQAPRTAYSMLHALVLPSWGGNTEFADLRAAYDALPDRTKAEVQDLRAEHYALHTRILLGDEAYTDDQKKAIPPAVWPLVQTHPGSGRKLLFVGVHARQIIGWPTAESRMYLQDLLEHATQRELVYRHEWQVGDLVMWDNRSTLHRGRRYDIAERRELRRTTIEDVPEARLMAA